MPKSKAPAVILVRPQMGENIGAVARAMSNFGLSELRLVAPRDGWPNPKAVEMAASAENIINAAKVYPDFAAATADIQFAYATTARPRDMEKRVVAPDAAMKEIVRHTGESRYPDKKKKQLDRGLRRDDKRVALIFGPERTGLENEEIAWCDTIITIPTDKNKSLNVAQSSVVVFYEWLRQSAKENVSRKLPDAAPKADWQGLFEQLGGYLDEVNYYRVAGKKPVMWQNLRNMLLRGQWNAQEVRTLRGMLRAIWERKTRNPSW